MRIDSKDGRCVYDSENEYKSIHDNAPRIVIALIESIKYMKTQRPFMNYEEDIQVLENNIKLIEKTLGKKWGEIKNEY